MRLATWVFGLAIGVFAVGDSVSAQDPSSSAGPKITWKKTVLDKVFRAEGVAVADVNKDGKLDVLNGEQWYEAPDWKPHPIRAKLGDHKDGLGNYSNTFACWAEDINKDGWPDLIVIDFPGAPCYWFENPQGKATPWPQHEIWHSACNETPLYVDLLGNGQRVLLMGWQPKGKANEGAMAYFTPGKDPKATWEVHPISEGPTPGKAVPGTQRFSHGLGAADVNGDGKLDVLCTNGWWEQPSKVEGKPWKWHAAPLGEACADMHTADLDGDGKLDVLSSSAHKFGIWAYLQRAEKGGESTFVKEVLFKDLVSETHAMHLVDIDGDGLKDMVTGKRFWSHGRAEPGANGPAMIYWFKAVKKGGLITFEPQVIDDNSGIGTQFTVQDINGDGLLDVITSNKKGTYVIVQERAK